jgi:hypothetical protein
MDAVDIASIRNTLATMVLNDKALTHILFIDNDMSFSVSAVVKMVEHRKPIIGCAYPRRNIDLAKLTKLGPVSDATLSRSMDFAVYFEQANLKLEVTDGAIRVHALGTGLMLIERAVFEKLRSTVASYREHPMRHHGFRFPIYGFFDHITLDGKLIQEDFAFCHRWRKAGGEVFALITETVGHVGGFLYQGQYELKLRSGEG